MGKIVLVLGGIKSGKSRFAENLVNNSGTVSYIATAKPVDDEMKQKIEDHKKRRPKSWQTVEPDNRTIEDCLNICTGSTIIIDCLGNLITQIIEGGDFKSFIKDFPETIARFKNSFENIILVSNETGLSLVSEYKSGRQFSNYIGLLNQKIAGIADDVYLILAGLPLKIK